MKTVLITGGFGALGTEVARLMERSGYVVYKLGRNPRGAGNSLAADVSDYASVQKAVSAVLPDMILHLAATFENDMQLAISTNLNGAVNLMKAVSESGRSVRVVLAGSAAEYGAVEPHENPISPDRALKPVSVYGLTKSWQTAFGLFSASRGADVVIARIFNLHGEGLSGSLFAGRLVAKIAAVKAGESPFIQLGNLSAARDYIGIPEAAAQIKTVCEKGLSGEVYHIASGVPVTMREISDRILREHGLDEGLLHSDEKHSNHVGYDVPVIYADIGKTLRLAD
jgi:GDP-4-dehydro-6-deoxy-D-mannose reductase